jgi:hypothetical protein
MNNSLWRRPRRHKGSDWTFGGTPQEAGKEKSGLWEQMQSLPMLHLGRTVGADKRGLHASSTGDIEGIDALGVSPKGSWNIKVK